MRKIFLLIILVFFTSYIYSNDMPVPDTYFGMHTNYVIRYDRAWPAVPFKTWRLWDTGIAWPEIQPNRDEWKFEKIDKAVQLAEEHNVELLINIGMCPKWAAARPNDKGPYSENLTPSEPKDIEDWRIYVRTLAERYKGKIKYWEIWNEPDYPLVPSFFTGTPKKMVELVKEAYIILKEIDPENKIISPAVTGYVALLPWLKSFLAAGGKDYIDIIGTHFYVWFNTDTPEKAIRTINTIKEYQKEFGIENIPIWDTECGYKQGNITDKNLQMAYIARLSIIQWAYGVDRMFPYSWDNKVIIRMSEKDNITPNHVGKAYIEIQKWMIGATVKDTVKVGNDIWIVRLQRNGKEARMIWHSNDNNPDFKIDYTIPDEWIFLKKMKNLSSETFDIPQNRNIQIGVSPLMLYDDGFFAE